MEIFSAGKTETNEECIGPWRKADADKISNTLASNLHGKMWRHRERERENFN